MSVFDKLVMQLSTSERKELLEKFRISFSAGNEPLFEEDEARAEVDLEIEYKQAGFLTRLCVFLKSIFSGKELLVVFEERLLKNIEKRIEKVYPGLVHFKENFFLSPLYTEIEALRNAITFLRFPLEKAMGKDKMDFIAFLGGMEMEIIQDELLRETDPFQLVENYDSKSDGEIRQQLEYRMEDIIEGISDQDKENMYRYSKVLYLLNELVFFPFDKLLSSFITDDAGRPVRCFIREIDTLLLRLANILLSLRLAPESTLLEGMFLFNFRDEIDERDFKLEEKVNEMMEKADYALACIRRFNKSVPMEDILKLTNRNINYHPVPIGGGEDWFKLYKQFWQNRFEKQFKEFVAERKKNLLLKSILKFVKLAELPKLTYYRTGAWRDITIKHELSLLFLTAFYEQIFIKEMNYILKIILIDGDFYKEQNRQEFTDAYNELNKIKDYTKLLEYRLSPAGEIGKTLEKTEKEIIAAPIKKKKMEAVFNDPEKDVENIISKVHRSIGSLENILDGILHGEVGGKYDTLSNRVHIGGKENRVILKEIGAIADKLNKARELLDSISEVENRLWL
ncbi:MAG: DUF5312 family protein [Spirochaetota bacterium]